jgi:hypothetical protein
MAFTAADWGQGRLLTGLSPGSSLTGFTAVITKANLPTSALDTGSLSGLNGGGDFYFATDINGANQLPGDIVTCVTNATASSTEFKAEIRFPTYASGTREVYAFWNKAGQSQPLPGASFGSEEVWQDFLAALHLYGGSLADSTGNGYSGTLGGTSPTALSVQGYSFSDGFISLGAVPLNGRSTVSVYCTFENAAASADKGIWYLNNDEGAGDEPFGLRQDSAVSTSTETVTFQSGFSQATGGYRIGHQTNSSTTSVQRSCNVFDNQAATVYMDGANDLGTLLSSDTSTTLNVGTGDLRIGTGPKDRYTGEIYSFYVKETADSADFCASRESNQSNPSTFWTLGTVFVPGGGGVPLTVAGIATAQSISNVTLTQQGFLSVDSLTTSQAISSPDITQQNILASDNLLTTQALSNVDLIVAGALSVNSILSASTLSSPSLTQANVLSVDAITTGQTLSNVSLLVAGGLSVDGLSTASTLSNVSIIQQHLLNVDPISSAQILSNVTLAVEGELTVDSIQNSQTISNAGLVSHAVLITNSITNDQLIGTVTLNQESIGTVTAAFKADTIGVEYGIATFTVKFKG